MTTHDDRVTPATYARRFVHLQSLFDKLPAVSISILDAQYRALALNRGMARLLRSSVTRLSHAPVADRLESLSPALMNLLQSSLERGRNVTHRMLELEVPGDATQSVLVTISRLEARKAAQRGILLLVFDVSAETRLRERVLRRGRFGELVGRSRAMKRLYERIEFLNPSDASVLIVGETGTGKELVARTIHKKGLRKDRPFVAVQCSALPEHLIESELFGHVKGAFTGARSDRKGRFERADGGTLFLDEIATLSMPVQSKLLRVLDRQLVEPLGATRGRRVDVRILSATNRDPRELMDSGRLRPDLYYRLKGVEISVPPLRKRSGDIRLLSELFLQRLNQAYDRDIFKIGASALSGLRAYPWPGNVRELENAMEHAFLHCRGSTLQIQHLPREIAKPRAGQTADAGRPQPADDREIDRIKRALQAAGGNRSEAARRLGMHRSTLWRKLREFGIPKRFGKS